MSKKRGKGRVNVYFRQTMSALKGARQASVFAKINRNIPYSAITFSKKLFSRQVQELKELKSWKGKDGSGKNRNNQKKKA